MGKNTIKMDKIIVKTEKAPKPIGPYSQAVWHGNTLYLSGQIALNPLSDSLVVENIEDETTQVMENIKGILTSQGLDFTNIIKTSIFLINIDDFNQVNTVYGKYFSTGFPARETIQVAKLPKNVNIEISVIAAK